MITENMKPITREDIKVLGRIVNISTEGIVADAAQIWDSDWTNPSTEGRKDQSWINQWILSKMNDILSGNVEFDHLNVRDYIKSPKIYVDDIYPYTEGSDVVNIHNDLNVDHKITCNELEVKGDSNLNRLFVASNAWFYSRVYFEDGIDVHGDSKFYDDVEIDGSVHIHNNLTVDGDTNLNNLTVNGTFNFHGQEVDLTDILRRLRSLEERVAYLEECCEEMHQPKKKYSINWSAVNESNRTVASGSISNLEEGDSGNESVLSGYTILSVNPSSGSIYGDMSGKVIWSNISSNGSVTFNVVGSDEPTPGPEPTNYTVTWVGSNYTHSNTASSVAEGSQFSSSVNPNTDYEITSVIVTMGGTAVDAYNNGNINIGNVTGNIVITVETKYIGGVEPNLYTITWNGRNYTHSNQDRTVIENTEFTSTVTPDTDYEIVNVVVTMGEDVISAYNDGTINIPSVTGNVDIMVNARYIGGGEEPIYHTITWDGVNFSHSNMISKILDGNSFTSTITPNEGYNIAGVRVLMNGNEVPDAYSNGTVNIPSVTEDVVIYVSTDRIVPPEPVMRNLTVINVIDGVASEPVVTQIDTVGATTVNEPTMAGYTLTNVNVNGVDQSSFGVVIPEGTVDITITYTWEKDRPTIPEGSDFITAMNDIMSDSSWGYFDAFGYAKNITGLNFNGGKVKSPAVDSESGLNTEASDTMVRYVKVDDQNGLYIPNTAGNFELPDYKALSGDSNLDKLFIYGIDRNSVNYMGSGATTGKQDGINSIAVGNGGVTVTKASKDTVDRNMLLVAAAYYAPQDADGKVSQSDCEYIVDNLMSNEFFDGAYIMTVKSYGDFSYNTVTDKTVVPGITTLRTSTTGRNVRYPFTTLSGGETSTYASLNVYQSGPFSYLGDETPSLRYSNSSQSTNNTDATVYMNEIPFSFKSTSELPVTYEDGKMTRGNFTYEIIADDWVGITSNGNGTYTLTNKDNVASGTSSKVKVAVNCSTAKTNDHYVDDQDAVVVNPNIFEYPIINVDTIIAA